MTRPRTRWLLCGVFVGLLLAPVLWGWRAPALDTHVALPTMSGNESARSYAVYVANYGYHSAIIVQLPASYAQQLVGRADSSVYMEYAWGDRRFYMESRFAPWSVFATLVWPTEAVTYVATHTQAPEQRRGWRELQRRDISAESLASLVASLERWIVRDSSGMRSAPYDSVPAYAGRFYPGRGRYSWWFNCNRWTVATLVPIGLATSPRAVLWPRGVLRRLKGFALAPRNV